MIASVQFSPWKIEKRDVGPATLVAIVMISLFVAVGGKPLLLTFVPAVVTSWLIFIRIYRVQRPLPKASHFLPLFYLSVAWQFAHFGEELATGFQTRFPELYGAAPFPTYAFIMFNMISYLVLLLCTVLVFARHLHFFLVPVLFFIV